MTTNVSRVQEITVLKAADATSVVAAISERPDPLRWQLIAALAAVYLIWGSTYLGMKTLLASFPALGVGALRFGIAGTILFGVHLLRRGRVPTWREVLHAAPIGILMFVGGNGFIALAQHEVASGVTAIVASTTPLWAALLGPLFGVPARAAEWVGVVLGTIGVALLGAHSDLGSDPGMIVVLLLAPTAWALGSMLARREPPSLGFASPAMQMLWGALGLFVTSTFIGETWKASPPAEAWAIFAYLVVFGSLIGFTAFHWLIKNTRPSVALSYSYVNPAIAVFLGVAIGHEPLHETTIAATVILVAAVAVVVRSAVHKRR